MSVQRRQKTAVIRDPILRPGPFDWSIEADDSHDAFLGQLVTTKEFAAGGCGVFLLGLPFDGAVLGRRGAAAGPRAIRAATRRMKAYSFSSGELTTKIWDAGDVEFGIGDVSDAHNLAEINALKLLGLASSSDRDRPARVVALGGDHSLTYPCAVPYLERYGDRLAVINLDAHMDVREVPQGELHNSGTSFGRLLSRGLKSYTVIGARDFLTSPHYVKRVQDAGGKIHTASEVFSRGAETVAKEALSNLPADCEAIYLSVDVDVADSSVAPAVSAPTPGGLLAHQIFELVRIFCADARTIACDIMELAPMLAIPGSDRTPRLAAGCLGIMAEAGK